MAANSILIVEDDIAIRRLISAHLKSHGFNIVEAWSVGSAARLLAMKRFDAMILDLELEDGEGFELLRSERAAEMLTLVVSAREQIVDRIVSFELGADDYLTKPIDFRELLMRLRRSMRRGPMKRSDVGGASLLDIDSRLKLNIVERAVMDGDNTVCRLTNREFKLLCLFLKNPSVVVARARIAREVIGHALKAESRVVDVLVSDLRLKLHDAEAATRIRNVRGEGYVMGVERQFLDSTTTPDNLLRK